MGKVENERLENLLDGTIKNFYSEVNPNNSIDLFDTMYKHLLSGDLDKFFIAPNIPESAKESAFELARKYSNLCFFEGDYLNWEDSVEGLFSSYKNEQSKTASELLAAARALDNYNFLLEVAHEKGEDALKEMAQFAGDTDMAAESAIVEYLRNTFGNDEALKECLEMTSIKDGKFDHVPTEAKEIMYRFPQGVLFFDHNEEAEINNFEGLLERMVELEPEILYTTNRLEGMENLEEVVGYLGTGVFDVFIGTIYEDYMEAKKHGSVDKKRPTSHR